MTLYFEASKYSVIARHLNYCGKRMNVRSPFDELS
jgi:hypothetical protein